MAWPSGTKAGTTHLDAGTDSPGLARADIKQNVDNVNAIIDEFGDVDIASPSDNDIIVYDSATSKWTKGSAGGASQTAYLKLGQHGESIQWEDFNGSHPTGHEVDPSSLMGQFDNTAHISYTNRNGNADTAYGFTLQAGTYLVKLTGIRAWNTDPGVSNAIKVVTFNEVDTFTIASATEMGFITFDIETVLLNNFDTNSDFNAVLPTKVNSLASWRGEEIQTAFDVLNTLSAAGVGQIGVEITKIG